MVTSVNSVLDQLRSSSTSKADQGARFEQLTKAFLKTDPVWAEQFSDVYLWGEWSEAAGKHDTGIDLVAVDRETNENVAIQCKFYDAAHPVSKKDIDTFLSASGKSGFGRRIIVSTGAQWGKNAEDAIHDQQVPVQRIGLSDLEASPIDWGQFTWDTPEVLTTVGKKTPRPHQRTAIENVTKGFLAGADRGKLIMACGTGKTFTSLRLAEEVVGAGGTVLFLVPSISLLSQTIREWATEASVPLDMIAICSDPKATKRSTKDEDISSVDLALPATTNIAAVTERWRAARANRDSMTVVFSTYQSIDVVAQAQHAADADPFDLIICDEAHRTTGVTLAGTDESAFVRVHDNTFLPAAKRLYMTATPRIFGDDTKKRATEADAVLASMDDEETFGPEMHRLGFGEAVEKDLLTDYRVLVLAVDEQYIADNFQTALAADGEIPLGDAAKIVGCWNGLAKNFTTSDDESTAPMRRAVAFARDIKTSKAIADAFPRIVDTHTSRLDPDEAPQLAVQCEHVDGTFNALERNTRLDWLKSDVPDGICRILTNARCLSEGVDVPALDAVLFLTPRSSEVDVVQSVGRVMRKAPGKDYGYIILPIATPTNVAPEQALKDNNKYKVVWQVLQALRAHDDRFNATINQIDLNQARPDSIKVIGIGQPETKPRTTGTEQLGLTWDFEEWQDAVYARIVQKVGERRYWETWASDVADIATMHITRINALLNNPDSGIAAQFDDFLDGLRGNLNDTITRSDAVEMLAQHLITRPVFDALFGGTDFTEHNPVAQRMEGMLTVLDEHSLDTENASLEGFYNSVRSRVDGIDNAAGRQRIIVELYDKFFATAFKRTVDKLGIVYTPIEIVDFILTSANDLLTQHFGQSLSDEGVHILDGFTGTGTFITRLLQSGLITPHDLARKYTSEIHANEILLLAYYIAAVNIETTYQDLRGQLDQPDTYTPFPGLVLTDTFQSYEDGDRDDIAVFPINNERINKQRELPITVIIGNPPYSVGQDSANDNNTNTKYEHLDHAIRDTYAERSTATNKNSLYDSYIRAIKWASLRLGERGIIAYITNGGWIDANTTDGMRLTLADEFSDIHIYNLRGNQRMAGEQRLRQGGKIFDTGSRATIAITIFVRDPAHTGPARIHYTETADYLTREQKLATISTARSVTQLESRSITPNEHGDWINHRRVDFHTFIPIGDKSGEDAIFEDFGPGMQSNRDAWVYNASRTTLTESMSLACETYFASAQGNRTNDPSRIKWSSSLESRLKRGERLAYSNEPVRKVLYRPFERTCAYPDYRWIHRPGVAPRAFPTPAHPNTGIMVMAPRPAANFASLALNALPDLSFYTFTAQFFARWRYVPVADGDVDKLDVSTDATRGDVVDGYRRVDNITDAALAHFQSAYGSSVSKDDIYFYVYGILHSPDYRATYAADLKKSLPRIPLVTAPQPYITAGRDLHELHLSYESVEPFPLDGLHPDSAPTGEAAYEFYRVQKMRRPKVPDLDTGEKVPGDTVIYNQHITLSGIPDEANEYMLGSRSAIDWIIDRYQVKTDSASGIVNDPNDWSREVADPRYIVDLLARIVTVSISTTRIVQALPPLTTRDPSDHDNAYS